MRIQIHDGSLIPYRRVNDLFILGQRCKSPTRTPTTQTNHFVAALWTFTKLELLKVRTNKNHYALKTHLYLSALQQAFEALCQLEPVRLDAPTA